MGGVEGTMESWEAITVQPLTTGASAQNRRIGYTDPPNPQTAITSESKRAGSETERPSVQSLIGRWALLSTDPIKDVNRSTVVPSMAPPRNIRCCMLACPLACLSAPQPAPTSSTHHPRALATMWMPSWRLFSLSCPASLPTSLSSTLLLLSSTQHSLHHLLYTALSAASQWQHLPLLEFSYERLISGDEAEEKKEGQQRKARKSRGQPRAKRRKKGEEEESSSSPSSSTPASVTVSIAQHVPPSPTTPSPPPLIPSAVVGCRSSVSQSVRPPALIARRLPPSRPSTQLSVRQPIRPRLVPWAAVS